MKINKIKTFLAAALSIGLLSSCVNDDDTKVPEYNPLVFGESFNAGFDNTLLEIEGWKNYAQAGTARWKTQVYQNNGYAEFTSFQSGNPSNIGWLISPPINLDQHEGEK